MDLDLVRRQVEVAHQLAQRASATGYLAYLDHVVIDAPVPGRFADLAYPWQWGDARLLAPALESVSRFDRGYAGPRNFWFTRARGHDKTTSLARAGLWLLAFSQRRVKWAHAASDGDQAALLVQAMERQIELNPWLKARVTVAKRGATGCRGSLDILTSDSSSAFGDLPDLTSVDEITWWKKEDLWGPLWSARDKRPHALVWVITNAGVLDSWQHKLVELAKRNANGWHVWDEPRRLPTWMNEADIQENRKLLPRGLAKRVFDNLWIDAAEESGFLTREEVAACEALGRDLGLSFQLRGRPGVEYVLVVDYGPTKDRTALAVMHQEPGGRVIVDRLDVWQGSREEPVQISRIHQWIEEQRSAFGQVRLVLDPYQMEGTAQHYEMHVPTHRHEARGGKGNYAMAECLRTLVINRQIAWYPGAGVLVVEGRQETLADEMAGLVLRPMSYGYRFDHEAGKHDDRTVCLGMGALVLLHQMAPVAFVSPPALELPKPKPAILRARGTDWGLWGASRRERDRW
jgi:hypothetical protein